MSTCRMWVKALLLAATVAWAAPAQAGVTLAGANTDFPDVDLVMPFSAVASRSTFLSISNIGAGKIRARWAFFDESGALVDQVQRDIYGESGTDIVDVLNIRDRVIADSGQVTEGPSRSLAGTKGFVIVYGDGAIRLVGNFTIANLETNSAFGVNASGFGIGVLAPGQGVIGTTFNPQTLQDNLIVIIGLNGPPALNSLTNGTAASGVVFTAQIFLLGNDPNDSVVAQTTREVRGSALFTSIQELFPGQAINGSASIFVVADGVGIIGYYGQAVGPFGAGQTLRAAVEPAATASAKAISSHNHDR